MSMIFSFHTHSRSKQSVLTEMFYLIGRMVEYYLFKHAFLMNLFENPSHF